MPYENHASKVAILLGLILAQSLVGAMVIEPAQNASSSRRAMSDNPTLEFSASGGICSWQVLLREDVYLEALSGCGRELLGLALTIDETDASGRITWERKETTGKIIAEFEGIDRTSGVRIIRQYFPGKRDGTLRHKIVIDYSSVGPGSVIKIGVTANDSLARHIPNDQSLGDFFYGYRRLFARSDDDPRSVYRVLGEAQSLWVAMNTRHIVIVLQQVGDGAYSDFHIEPPQSVGVKLVSGVSSGPDHSNRVDEIEIELDAIAVTSVNAADKQLTELIYADAGSLFRYLSFGIDRLLGLIGGLVGNMGVAVILFAVLVRILLFPISLWSLRQQREYSEVVQAMQPEMVDIKTNFKGEEKSERMLALYKKNGISPFSGLKGSVALFVQIPFLVALFNVTAESAIFRVAPFLWLSDLSLPDQALQLPLAVPVLGSSLNLLPLALGAVTFLVGVIESRQKSTSSSSNKTAAIFTAIILVFFYSCSAALVLYWITVNIVQIFERSYVRRLAT